MLYNNKKPFIIERSRIMPNTEVIGKVDESRFESRDIETQYNTINLINNILLKKSLTDGEREFLHMIVKYASTNEKSKSTYIDDAVFITENYDFLGKFIATDNNSVLHFRAFFPTLRLVNIDQGLEVLDMFAKSSGYYFGTRTE